MARATYVLVLALLGSVLLASSAQALYVMTPLRISPTDSEGHVGDGLRFDVAPDPESNVSYAGQTLTIRYEWDPMEGAERSSDEPVSDDSARHGTSGTVTLDAKGTGSFTWTIPAEVDDRNVGLSLVDDAGEKVAFAYVRVGDAEPQARIMAGGGGAPLEGGEPLPEPTSQGDASTKGTPGAAPLAVAAVVGLAALALARRK